MINVNCFFNTNLNLGTHQKLYQYTELPMAYIPAAPPMDGAKVQVFDVKRNIFLNIKPEDNGNISIDIISPQNHKILEHHSINPQKVVPSNASCLELLALEEYLASQGECERMLTDLIMQLYKNDNLNKKCDYTKELKTSADNFIKFNSFALFLKDIQATNAILNWKGEMT